MEKGNPNQNKSKNRDRRSQGRSGLSDYLKYAGMGFQMLAIILILTWVGIRLDDRSPNDTRIYTAIFALLGVIIGIYTALKDFIHKDKSEN